MFLTCKFKLHNPSKHKRDVLMNAFEQYTLAYQDLLEWARENEDMLKENGQHCTKSGNCKYTAMSLSKLLPKTDRDLHSSLKDSLYRDLAGNLASYFELGEEAGFPEARTFNEKKADGALDFFSLVGSDLDDYNKSRDNLLMKIHNGYMPLYFSRPDGVSRNRNFSLLVNTDKRQLLATLYLLPARHKLCKPLGAKQGNLIRIDTGEVYTSNSKTAILVPLQIGRNGWQEEKFLQPAMDGEISVKVATLTKENDDFYLAVAFEFDEPKPYKPETYLGIDRGVFYSMAYAIVNGDGDVIDMVAKDDGFRSHVIQASKSVQKKQKSGKKVTIRDYKRKEGEAILHRLVNEIIEVAKEHKSMIVMEDLSIRIRGKFYKSAWKKMYDYFEYKCKLAGVPLYKNGIWAAYSSQICIYCGELNKERKRDGSPFTCPFCGSVYNSDAGAGVNIARRVMYKKSEWENNGGYRAFHRGFAKDVVVRKQLKLFSQT